MKNREIKEIPDKDKNEKIMHMDIGEVKFNTHLDIKKADEILESRIVSQKEKQIGFGSLDKAKKHLDKADNHMKDYRDYMRKANTLDSEIKRKRESMMTEVKSLRKKADNAKREADRYKRYAKMEITNYKE